jgi:CDP-diacylglycerol--inositol 3-phosphatidyltransferase
LVCCLNEVFFIALYLVSFSFDPLGATADNLSPSYKVLFKPWSAGALELARANKIDLFVPYYTACICLPVMLLKQYLNFVQLGRASKILAEGDCEARRAVGLPRKKIQ